MVSATAQLNVRIGADLKHAGDEVFARYGLSPSEVVRSVWSHAARQGKPPAFMVAALDDERSRVRARKLELIEQGAGLALRAAVEQGVVLPRAATADWDADCRALRVAAYDVMTADALHELAGAKGAALPPAEKGGCFRGHDA